MTNAQIAGYSRTRTVEGVPKDISVATVRFNTPESLDAIFTGDGSTTILQFLKQIAQQIVELEPSNPLPPNWSQIVKVPINGTKVIVSFGIRSEFEENKD